MFDFDEHGETTRKPQGKHYRTVNGKTVRVCDECGADMVIRTNRATQEKFLGCTRYPECMHSEPLPIDQQLRAAGAKGLPGFGDE